MHEPMTCLANKLAAITAAVLFTACGSSSPTTPVATPTPTPAPVMTLLNQGSTTNLLPHHVRLLAFTTVATGRIDAIVDWTYATDTVLLVVATGHFTCYDGQVVNFNTCNVIASVRDATKPEKLSLPGQPAGVYTLYVDNIGPDTEAISWQIFVTTPG